AQSGAAPDEDPGLSQTWSTYSVLNVLYSFVQKSRINEYLDAIRTGKTAEEIEEIIGPYGSRPLYRLLGYFSLIGLLRVHVLLGDYTLGLKVVEHVDLAGVWGTKATAIHTRVTACHVATFYYIGFCYFSMRRYADASRTFASVLNFIGRMRQYHTRSYQYDQINKTADRMYALFALCSALAPQSRALDAGDGALQVAKERFSDQTARMTRGDLTAYEELYSYACPKFVVPVPEAGPGADHLALFREDVRSQMGAGSLRGFLKMYKTVDIRKMAAFLESEFGAAEGADSKAVEDEVVMEMMVLKQASRSISRLPGSEGSLLDGQSVATSDLDFVIDENIVHVAESTVGRRYAGWFIRNAEGAERAYDSLRALPLPG
ncbi:translation initiation factor 3 complex subunit L, partial [Auriculariales sp. MPI-PUGE-AT-0066]